MENLMTLLPAEVKDLAVRVSEKKQEEVNTILNQIFAGTADWEKQVELIEVKGIHDSFSIQLADVARKNIKTARLAAEKLFDAKRDEVQNAKAEFDLEDKLWLKAKQVMQLKFKAIEEKAEWKARTVERYEAEQKELRIQVRIEKVHKFNPEVSRIEIEYMGDDRFDLFLSSLEKAHNDKIEAARKAEEERIAREKAEAEERERIRLENERLRKEAAEKEKQLAIERAKVEVERKEAEEKAKKEREATNKLFIEQKVIAERERRIAQEKAANERAEADAILKLEREANEKLQAQIKERAEEEERIRKAKEAEEKKAKAAPDKIKLQKFADAIDALVCEDLKTQDAEATAIQAKSQLSRVSKFIRESIINL